MKLNSFFVCAAILSSSFFLTSCEDILGPKENPSPIVIPGVPTTNTSTTPTYVNAALMDFSVKPGDSFYHYALGNWLANHDKSDEGLVENLTNSQTAELKAAFYSSTDEVVSYFTQCINDSYTETQALNDILIFLKDMGLSDGNGIMDADMSILTLNDVLTALGNLQTAGFSPLLKRVVNTYNGQFTKVLTSGSPSENTINTYNASGAEAAKDWIKYKLSKLQEDKTEVISDDIITAILTIETILQNYKNPQYSSDIQERQHAKPVAPLKVSDIRARTRTAATDVYTAFDVTEDYVDPNAKTIIDNYILTGFDAKTLGYFICYKVLSELESIIPDPSDEKFNLKDNLYTKLSTAAPQIINRVDYEELKDKCDIEGCAYMMEQLRQVMDQRIANLEWMGDETKAKAREKLAAMLFNIGVPENKPAQSLTLNGATLIQNVLQLYQQREATGLALVGQSIANLGWDYYMLDATIGTFNAFYMPNLNQLIILPAFVSSTMFPSNDEYMRYATATVFAHEISHGFDASGSQFNKQGTMEDWWAAADKTQFAALQDQMKERFNELWQYDGVHADGVQTLDENMADLGGVRIAFELYRLNMIAAGYQQDIIDYKLCEFFLHYAYSWASDPTVEELDQLLKNDTHSANHNRVNGILRLMDEWYDLFEVTDGVNYLDPDKRVEIW